jgi:hypothetical protein
LAGWVAFSAFRITVVGGGGGGGGGARFFDTVVLRADVSRLGAFGSAAIDMVVLGITALGTGTLATGASVFAIFLGATTLGTGACGATAGGGGGGGGERRPREVGAWLAADGLAWAGGDIGAGGADGGASAVRVTVGNGTVGIFAPEGGAATAGAIDDLGRAGADTAEAAVDALGRAGAGPGSLRVTRRIGGIGRKFGICSLRSPRRPAKSGCSDAIGATADPPGGS